MPSTGKKLPGVHSTERGRWSPLFAHEPVESLVHAHQADYYRAINASTAGADSRLFVEFMLTMIRSAVTEAAPEVEPEVTPEVERLLAVLTHPMSRQEIQQALGLRDEKNFLLRFILPALAAGLVERSTQNLQHHFVPWLRGRKSPFSGEG